MSRKNNWFYLIMFIIINLFFSEIVVSESEYSDLLLKIYPFISIYIPITLLLILNLVKRDKDLLKTYVISSLAISIVPWIFRFFLDENIACMIKITCSVIVNIYLLWRAFKKEKNIEVEVKNANTEEKEDECKKSYSFKYIALIVYNLIILLLTLTTNWDDWGAIIMSIIMVALIFVGSPLLSILLFKRHSKRGAIICSSFIISLLMLFGGVFFQNTDNIKNLTQNIQEEKEIEQVINNQEENISIYNNDDYTILLNPNSKELNILKEKSSGR